jgi:hypothetical protein
MPKYPRKLPMAPTPNEAHVTLNWQQIRSGRFQLSADAEQRVIEVTEAFVELDELERSAELLEDAKAILNVCRKAARQFQQTLLDHAFKSTDAGDYARSLLNGNFDHAGLNTTGKPLDTLFSFLGSFRIACAKATSNARNTLGFDQGNSWRLWIERLANIWEDNGLKVSARKDSGGGQSPFVGFVIELQKCLPPGCTVPYAASATARAVSRVLKFRANNPFQETSE